MAMFRTLLTLTVVLYTTGNLYAQTTWFVRAGGNATNNGLTAATAFREIADITNLADGDVIDIGAGVFDGATIAADVHIAGSNAGYAGFTQAATNLGTITMTGADQTLTIEGVRWSEGVVPVTVSTGTNVIVTITNCRLLAAGPITATRADDRWKELYISDCVFDGYADGTTGTTSNNALVATDLDVLSITENTFQEYVRSALSITAAAGSTTLVNTNAFVNNNQYGVTGSENAGAILFTSVSGLTSAEIHNNTFDADRNAVVTAGTISSNLSVRYNKISNVGASFFAVKNAGTGTLTATCNNYGANAPASTVRGLINGSVTALPYNYQGADTDGGAIGFAPNALQSCATEGPVKTTTTEAAGSSYFTISEAITASAAGATVKVQPDAYTEDLSISKSLTILAWGTSDASVAWNLRAADTSDANGRDASTMVRLSGTITITSAAREVTLGGLKVTRPTNGYTVLTTNALDRTKITACEFVLSSSSGLTSSSAGAIHQVRAGALDIQKSVVTRPGTTPIRALTFAAGNGARSIELHNSTFNGTVQLSGLSALSDVDIRNCTITKGGVDGVSVTGNYVRTLNIEQNTISDAQENGIAWRNGAAVGTDAATIKNNLITGSGQASSSSSYAAVNVGSATTGTQTFTDNAFSGQNGAAKAFINGRSGVTYTLTCHWWGSRSQDDIINAVGGAGTVAYHNGTTGWRYDGSNTAALGYTPGTTGTCTVLPFDLAITKTNASCNGATDGVVTATVSELVGGATVSSYSWTSGPTTQSYTGIGAGSYTVRVTSSTGNYRDKSVTVYVPTAITANAAATDITCFYVTDGTVTVSNVAGGTHADADPRTFNYTLKQANSTTVSYGPQTSLSFTGITAGTYDVYVTAIASTNGSLITNPACETLVREDIVIIRPAAFTAGAIASTGETICNAGTPAVTIGNTTPASGGDENITYSWRSSADGYTAVIPGANSATYLPPAGLLTTTSYRRYAKDGRCNTTPEVSSGTWTVTVNNVTAGVVGTSQTICEGSDVAAFTVTTPATGAGTLSYQWEKNTNLTTPSWSAISGATSDTYDEGTLTADAQYRRVTTSLLNGISCSATSNVITVTVNNLTAGEIAASQTICYSADPAAFTSTTDANGDGDVSYRWEKSTTSSTAGFSTISDASGSTYDDNTALTQTTHYRRIAISTRTGSVCERASNVVTVTVPGAQLSATVGKTDITCHSATDGTINVSSPQGGFGTYEYRLNNLGWQTSGSFTGLDAGTYSVQIRDGVQTACVVTLGDRVISRPAQLTATMGVPTHVVCNGGSNGSVTVTAGGGTTPYTYSWTNGQTSQTATGLVAGTYGVTVTDNKGCVSTATATITQPESAVAITSSLIKDVCLRGESTGEITITASGGTGTLSYVWTKSGSVGTYATTQNITGLSVGTYTVKVNDANGTTGGCTATETYEVLQPAEALSATLAKTNITCFTATDGIITVSSPVGGWDTYSVAMYNWNTGALVDSKAFSSGTPAVFTGVNAGEYSFTVTTEKNSVTGRSSASCGTSLAQRITIYRPSQLTANVDVTHTSCNGSADGVLTISSPSGGTHTELSNQSYRFSIRNDGNTYSAGPQEGLVFTGLAPNLYYVTITAHGVSPSCSREIGPFTIDGPTGNPITAEVSKTNITCFGETNGTITVTGTTGGTTTAAPTRTYRYRWVRQDAATSGAAQESGSFTGLAAGTYSVYVIALADGNTPACTTMLSTQYIYEPTQVLSSTSKINISSNSLTDGQIAFTAATGGTHTDAGSRTFEYRLMKGSTEFGPQASRTFTGLQAGTYSASVIALATGSTPACTTTVSSSVIIYEPSHVVFSSFAKTHVDSNGKSNGSITVTATGGSHTDASARTFTYQLTPVQNSTVLQSNSTGSFTGLSAGSYSIKLVAAAEGGGVTPEIVTHVHGSGGGGYIIYAPTVVTTSGTITSKNPSCATSSDAEINLIGGSGGTHDDATTRTYRYTIHKVGSATSIGPQTSAVFTGLSAGTYNLTITALETEGPSMSDGASTPYKAVVPQVVTSIGQRVLTAPTPVTFSMTDNADTTGSYVRTGGKVTFTVTVQGGTPKATAPWYNVTWTLPGTQSTDPVFDAAGSSVTGGVYTMVYDLTGIDPDKVSGTYSIAITDDNACPASVSPGGSSSAVVNTYATVDLYVDNINGSHSTGTGTSQRPLASITKAIAIASSGETINIMQNESGSTPAPQQYTEDTYGPVITKLLTFKRVAFTYTGGTYSGLTQLSLEPSFVANKAFVLATSDVTFDGFTPSALYVRSDGTIQEALDNISSTGVVTLLDGTWTLTSPLTISKGVTFQGLPPTNTASVACDLNPTAKLKAAGSTKLMLFSGSAAKTVSNLDLEIGNAGAINGRFFEIQTGSAGNVAASNIIFRHDHNNDGASPIRLYGITNTDYSAGALNDVAKFVGDVTDGAGFGTGKVNYGNQAPLPISSLENGWKAEDAGTATTATTVSQLYPMTGLTQIRAATSAQRPVWRAAGATGIGGRAAVEFNGTSRVLSTTATSGYIGGAAKSLFVVFKTPNGDVADAARQVIYKHGDALDGMSIVFLGTTGVGEESVVLSVYTSAGATQFVASETIGVSKNTVYIAQLYFNGGDATNRVGVALDNDAGNVAKKTWAEAAFNTATLTSPTAGVNHNISVGAKNGHVRWGTAAGETNTTAGLGLYFGTTDGGQVGEVLVYNTANKAQRDAIYCYLRNKYLTDTDKNSLEKGTPDGDVVAGGDVAFTNEIDVYPNPADADVTITVATAAAGLLRIELVDALGRVVQTLHDEYVSSNSVIQSVADARDLASGTYVIRVTGAGNLNMSKPFIIRR